MPPDASSLAGTVVRTSQVKMLEMEKNYMCSKCGQHFSVSADFEQFYASPRPARCLTGRGSGQRRGLMVYV